MEKKSSHDSRRCRPSYSALSLACLLVVGLAGCPRGGGDAPSSDAQDSTSARNDGKPAGGAAHDGGDPAAPPKTSPTPEAADAPRPLTDAERKQFIAEMRKAGVSVEQDDDGAIVSLVMGFTQMSDERLAKLPHLPKLEFLALDHTRITDMGLEALAGRKSLRALQLGGNKLSAAGLKHIAGLENLEVLDLSDLPLGDDALVHLRKLKSLQRLNLSETKVTLPATIALAETLPGLEVSAPFGNLVGGTRLTMDAIVKDGDLAQLKSLESLRELSLAQCDGITDEGMDHVRELTRLTALELGFTQVTDAGLAKLTTLKDLRQLDVRDTQTSIAAVLKLVAALPKLHAVADWGTVEGATKLTFQPRATDDDLANLSNLPAVEDLSLWRCDKLTDAAMQHVAGCANLRSLNLGATNVGDAGLAALAHLPRLQRLVLTNTPTTGAGLAHVGKLKTLEQLDLGSTAVDDDGLQQLAGLAVLESLSLARTPITDAGIAQLAPLKNLKSLDLAETAVTGQFLKTAAGELPNLQSLDLSLTLADDGALEHVAGLKNLEHLDLWGTRVTDAGIEQLHAAKSLKSLGLFATAVSEEAVAELNRKLPEVDVTIGIEDTGK